MTLEDKTIKALKEQGKIILTDDEAEDLGKHLILYMNDYE